MLGRILNTHQQWLCRQLCDLGLPVQRQVAISDTAPEIASAIRDSLAHADLVICTGGLGPTSDDLTRDAIATLLGRQLDEDPGTLERIAAFFVARSRPMPASTRVQAMIPRGASILPNAHGTAPGLLIQVDPNPFRPSCGPSWLVMLPGPPRELHPMFKEQVKPWIQRTLGATIPFACRTLKTHGLGESLVEENIAEPLHALTVRGLTIGYCARVGEVEVRLSAPGHQGAALVEQSVQIVRSRLGNYIYGEEDDVLPAVVIRVLTEARRTLAVAESCTGGHISNRLTDVPGASAALLQAWVTYSNHSKTSLLGVPESLIQAQGAVSEPVARAMAEGARERSGADYGLAVTGIAGPGGGSPEKPVGTVFIGLATPQGTWATRRFNPLDRETFKYATSQQALDWVRRAVLGIPIQENPLTQAKPSHGCTTIEKGS